MKTSPRKKIATTILLFAIVLALANALTIRPTAAATHNVIIFDLAFNPQTLTISVGDTVVWQNNDPLIYTLWFVNLADGSTYLLSPPLVPGTLWELMFNEVMELQYYSFEMLWITGFINVVPAGNHDVAVTNVIPKKTVVGNGYVNPINATVVNLGDFPETFDVTAYANTTLIGTQTLSLAIGESRIITFNWNTAGFVFKGVYKLNVSATPVPWETNIANNNFIYVGTVKVTIPGDINGDFFVNIIDATQIGLNWQRLVPPAPTNADINGDGIVNIKDATIVGLNWLKDP